MTFLVGSNKVPVEVLQYADDTIFFGEASMANVKTVKVTLRSFELVSRLRINFAKSKFGVVGQSEEWCLHAVYYLNCALLQFPFCYLGIPIGVVWDPIIRKFEDRLNRWKMGRGDQILFWEDAWAEDGIPLKEQFPERQKLMVSGSSIKNHNKAVIKIKFMLVFLFYDHSRFKTKSITNYHVLFSKMALGLKINFAKSQIGVVGVQASWIQENGRVHCGDSHWWRDLRKIYQHNDFKIIHQNMAWKADNWLGEDCNLEQKYPQLFIISKQQNDLISNMGSFYQNNWRWDLKWRRHLFEHEEGVDVAFMEEISAYPIQCHLKDNLLWKADPTGMYSTRSAYRLLSNLNSFAPDGRNFQLIWKLKIPPKAAIFTWRLIKDRLPTRANLHRRKKLLYSCLPNRKLLEDQYLDYFVEDLLQLNIKRKLQSGRDKAWHSHWWKDLRRLYNQPDFHSIHQNMFINNIHIFAFQKKKNVVFKHFKERFSKQNPCRPTLDGIQFSSLGQEQKGSLVARFSEFRLMVEIKALARMEILKPDFIRFSDEFFINGIFPKGSNASFIALIPKIINPQSLNDYRPYFLELQLQLIWLQGSRSTMLKVNLGAWVNLCAWVNLWLGARKQLTFLIVATWIFLFLTLEFQWGRPLKAGMFGSLSSASLKLN
ncbi:hypothetical protein HKD37_19G053651 [Glycine soja]